jgi:uncharacterized membrane protein YhaH (DUF805 family)
MNVLQLLFSFYGRINRAKYWTGWAIVYAVFGLSMVAWSTLPENRELSFALGLVMLTGVFSLLTICAKRLHDLDITGWWVPVFFVILGFISAVREPMVTSLTSVVLFCAVVWLGSAKGDAGGNRHGPAPA